MAVAYSTGLPKVLFHLPVVLQARFIRQIELTYPEFTIIRYVICQRVALSLKSVCHVFLPCDDDLAIISKEHRTTARLPIVHTMLFAMFHSKCSISHMPAVFCANNEEVTLKISSFKIVMTNLAPMNCYKISIVHFKCKCIYDF